MRTNEEIIARIKEIEDRDLFGFEQGDLIICLPFEDAKQFLIEGVREENWKVQAKDRDSILAVMLDYMPFAWEKANNFRGLSAARSMCHFSSWVWLAGDDLGDLLSYEYYGKDNLAKICTHYGWDYSKWDDGVRSNNEPE